MKIYVEFNKQDYYGLVTVNVDEDGFFDYVDKATNIYVDEIAGENIEEILLEGQPKRVTKEYAFWKLANCKDSNVYTVGELLKEFEERENTCIVIDGSLV
ncbi:hypothetical protein ACWE42_14735 [Sutcliffiella cohnii]